MNLLLQRKLIEILDEYNKIGKNCDENFLVGALKTFALATNEIKFCEDQKSYIISTFLGLFYNQNMQIENLKKRIMDLELNLLNNKNYQKNNENYEKISEKTINFNKNNEILEKSKEDKNTSANEIFGNLVKFSRENNKIILYQAFEDIKDFKIENDKFIFVCDSIDTENVIKNNNQFIVDFLKSRYNISVIDYEITSNKDNNLIDELQKMLDNKVIVE